MSYLQFQLSGNFNEVSTTQFNYVSIINLPNKKIYNLSLEMFWELKIYIPKNIDEKCKEICVHIHTLLLVMQNLVACDYANIIIIIISLYNTKLIIMQLSDLICLPIYVNPSTY